MNEQPKTNSTSTLPSAVGQGAGYAAQTKPRNCCHRCGATAYKTLIARDEKGAMRPCGKYQCVQCKQVFRDVKEWRDGTDMAADHLDSELPQQIGLVN